MSRDDRQSPADLSFSEAMDELESVLRRIEGEEIDIDELGAELGRAAQLLEVCRKKIRRAEVEVRQIVEQIEEEGGGSDDVGAANDAPVARSAGEQTRLAATRGGDDEIPF